MVNLPVKLVHVAVGIMLFCFSVLLLLLCIVHLLTLSFSFALFRDLVNRLVFIFFKKRSGTCNSKTHVYIGQHSSF